MSIITVVTLRQRKAARHRNQTYLTNNYRPVFLYEFSRVCFTPFNGAGRRFQFRQEPAFRHNDNHDMLRRSCACHEKSRNFAHPLHKRVQYQITGGPKSMPSLVLHRVKNNYFFPSVRLSHQAERLDRCFLQLEREATPGR